MKEKEEKKNRIKDWIIDELKKRGIMSLSEIFEEAHGKYVEELKEYVNDIEQSWKPFKGKILENIILETIKEKIEELGFVALKGSDLEKENLEEKLAKVKRNLVIDFGEFGMHLPDADLVVYNPKNSGVLFIVSSKTTLRERIAQTGYWKLKLKRDGFTKNIKVFFVTLDEDGDLKFKSPSKKSRAIAEIDTDGTYVITRDSIDESDKVKKFEKFLDDIKKLYKKILE